jgi:oxaloacetate decarboxylase alpha subunit
MITPHSQYVVTQAAINVALGERYKVVIDEVIQLALGVYGEDSGYTWMDQNVKDKLLSLPRAKELAARKPPDVSMKELRAKLGGSDEEFLLRYIMKGEQEIAAMRAAGPWKPYYDSSQSLLTLLQEFAKQKSVRYVRVQRGGDALVVGNRS